MNEDKLFKNQPVIDAHSHIFPPRLFKRIWEFFEENYWHVKYKMQGDKIDDFYAKVGVDRYTTLNYAHKPNISRDLNVFTHEFHKSHPKSIPLGTVHPRDENPAVIAEEALTTLSLKGFKLQLLVTDFYIHDSRLDPVFEIIKKEDAVLVVHAGTGPLANDYVGVEYFKNFLDKYSDIKVQVAHLGCFQYEEFFNLLKNHPNMRMDDAMILVPHDLFNSRFELDPNVLLEHQSQLMYGSDFPNIPYDFHQSYQQVLSYEFPEDFYEDFFYNNAKEFFGL